MTRHITSRNSLVTTHFKDKFSHALTEGEQEKDAVGYTVHIKASRGEYINNFMYALSVISVCLCV